jgi:cysteine-rich repeat protein
MLSLLSNQIGSKALFAMILLCCCSHRSVEQDSGETEGSVIDAALDDASTPRLCGNGLVDLGEVCDDGNTLDGDTCSSDCQSMSICPNGILEADVQIPSRSNIDIVDLAECKQINGTLVLVDDKLSNLDELSQLTTVEGDLIIGAREGTDYNGSYYLKDIKGLHNLVSIGGDLIIGKNAELTSLEGLNNLRTIGGDFIIRENNLHNLDGLDQLTSVGGSVLITGNRFDATLTGPPHLVRVGGNLVFGINVFENLKSIPPKIEYGLEKIAGFAELASIGGYLDIVEPLVNEINAFGKLETIGDYFSFSGSSLSEFRAFGNLSSIGGDVTISWNTVLEQLWIPPKNVVIGGDLFIVGNTLLPTCQAQDFQNTLRENGFAGQATICGNQDDECGSSECPSDLFVDAS